MMLQYARAISTIAVLVPRQQPRPKFFGGNARATLYMYALPPGTVNSRCLARDLNSYLAASAALMNGLLFCKAHCISPRVGAALVTTDWLACRRNCHYCPEELSRTTD